MPLQFSSQAFEDVAKEDVKSVKKKIDWIWEHREDIKHIPLGENLSGFFRYRYQKYRILYEYDKNNKDDMLVCIIGTRDTIYKDADKKYN
jgi:mRNA-degrading endonuclease RelE of RelBE toxin-antitoxin system